MAMAQAPEVEVEVEVLGLVARRPLTMLLAAILNLTIQEMSTAATMLMLSLSDLTKLRQEVMTQMVPTRSLDRYSAIVRVLNLPGVMETQTRQMMKWTLMVLLLQLVATQLLNLMVMISLGILTQVVRQMMQRHLLQQICMAEMCCRFRRRRCRLRHHRHHRPEGHHQSIFQMVQSQFLGITVPFHSTIQIGTFLRCVVCILSQVFLVVLLAPAILAEGKVRGAL